MRRSARTLLALPLIVLDSSYFEPATSRPCESAWPSVTAVLAPVPTIADRSALLLAPELRPEPFLARLGPEGSPLRSSFAEWAALVSRPAAPHPEAPPRPEGA